MSPRHDWFGWRLGLISSVKVVVLDGVRCCNTVVQHLLEICVELVKNLNKGTRNIR